MIDIFTNLTVNFVHHTANTLKVIAFDICLSPIFQYPSLIFTFYLASNLYLVTNKKKYKQKLHLSWKNTQRTTLFNLQRHNNP